MSRNLLFLTPQLPYPPHQGTSLRNWGLIQGLARKGYTLTLLSFLERHQPSPEQTPLAQLCEDILTVPIPGRTKLNRLGDLIAGQVDMARRLWSETFLEKLGEVLNRRQFDGIHFEGIELAAYLLSFHKPLRERHPDTRLVYDAHNAEYALQKRIAQQDIQTPNRFPQAVYSFIQASRLKQFESRVIALADHVFACSEQDASELRKYRHPTPITVVPNAIHVAAYSPDRYPEAPIVRPSIVFTGKMDFRPNVDAVLWFADEVFPLIRQEIPLAHFTIVGQKPHPRLSKLQGQPGITITGSVPAIQPYLRAADVYAIPLRMGSGTRLKLIEAMAMHCAIVSTTIGAEGFDALDGLHLLLADKPDEFACATITLLQNKALRDQIGAQAAELAQDFFDWEKVIPIVEAIYA